VSFSGFAIRVDVILAGSSHDNFDLFPYKILIGQKEDSQKAGKTSWESKGMFCEALAGTSGMETCISLLVTCRVSSELG